MNDITTTSTSADPDADTAAKNWYKIVVDYAEGNHNNTMDITKPHLRSTFANSFEFVIFMYLIISVFGVGANFAEIYFILKYKLYRDTTYVYLINLSIADIIKCLFVLPFSVTTLLLENWLFGGFLCYFLPMLQDVPTHVTILSMLMIAFDRYSFLKNPTRTRLPGFIFSTGTWLTAICVVLPYPIYTTYIDLGVHLNTDGTGLCLFNLEQDIKEYCRAISVSLFLVPVIAISYLYTQMAQIIEERSDETIIVHGFEIHLKGSLRRYYSRRFSGDRRKANGSGGNNFLDNYDTDPKEEEKRIQKFLIAIFVTFAFCFGCFMILRFVHLTNDENYSNTHHWDVMYAVMMWFAYVPSLITPLLVLAMIIRSEDISDLRNYIRMKRKDTYRQNIDDEDSQMVSVTYMSRPSATTISTDFGQHHEKSSSS
ncbi:neuropeptide Y receptor type 1-like [Planococcus citri]|uniref:neuropeptide Y receptor type 1-like n=1 Tax=Planococcus citri TaxID=170843 RepID=UPI0031F77E37